MSAAAFSCLSLSARHPVVAVPRLPSAHVRLGSERGALIVTDAQNKKRRQRTNLRDFLYNKHYRDLVKSNSRAVLKGYSAFLDDPTQVKSEADLKPIDEKMSIAFAAIDKALTKGILKKNTAARRMKKLTNVRKRVLIESGVYVPVSVQQGEATLKEAAPAADPAPEAGAPPKAGTFASG